MTPRKVTLIGILLICAILAIFVIESPPVEITGPDSARVAAYVASYDDAYANGWPQNIYVTAFPDPQPYLAISLTSVRGHTENSSFTFTELSVKNLTSGATVQSINLENNPITIATDGNPTTFQVNLTSPLTNGTWYFVELGRSCSYGFVSYRSSIFAVP